MLKPVGFEIDPPFFKNCPIGRQFYGKLKGISLIKNYYLGSCEVKEVSRIKNNGEVIYGRIKFILRKRNISLPEMIEIKEQLKDKNLILTFQGFSASGYPKFTHKFI